MLLDKARLHRDTTNHHIVAPLPATKGLAFCCILQGYYCLTIKLTIIAGSGLIGSAAVPLVDLWSTTQVRLTFEA